VEQNRQFKLIARLVGKVKRSDFEFATVPDDWPGWGIDDAVRVALAPPATPPAPARSENGLTAYRADSEPYSRR
jgi:hypothetical protein